MGVDASIFAKKSKTYLYFDRGYYLRGHWYVDDIHSDDYSLQESLYAQMNGEGCGLVGADIIHYLNSNIEYWEESNHEHAETSIFWSKLIIHFIEDHPDDIFFIANSNGNMYDLYDTYTEYKLVKEEKL